MMRDEEYANLMGAAEALLFVSDEPVSSAKLASILEVSPSQMDEVLALLAAEYQDENRGIQLREVAGGWRFYTHPVHHEIIEKYVLSWDTRKLSAAALEALAVIAYHQPVTRAGVNAVRGVNSEGVISSLVEKGLVREAGRDKTAGNAILYATTRTFLERFGLKSIKDLPPLEDFAPDEESREFIRERLSGVAEARDAQMTLEDEEDLEDAEDAGFSAVDIMVTLEDGTPVVQEIDTGDDERVDDPDAMAAIIGQAITDKADEAFARDGEPEDDEVEDIPTIES